MKRLFSLALVLLALAACQRETDVVDIEFGDAGEVTVNVSLTEQTRVGSDKGADLASITAPGGERIRYILEVYHKDVCSSQQIKCLDSDEAAFAVRLAPDREYTFVVWADIVASDSEVSPYYTTENGLKNITLKGEPVTALWKADDNSRDAFTATKVVENFSSASVIDMPLTRPFAKVRALTTDEAMLGYVGVKPTYAEVEYDEVFTAYNAMTATPYASVSNFKHEKFAITDYADDLAGEMTIFADYLFVGNNGGTVNFSLNVYDQNSDIIKSNNFNTDIPIKRNTVTTIKGSLLTSGTSIDVGIDGSFAGGVTFVNNAAALHSAIAEARSGGVVVLNADITLDDVTRAEQTTALEIGADKNITLDLNGRSLTMTKACTASYSMITNKGELTIKDGVGGGKISFTDTGTGDPSFGWGSYTITNSNTLVVEGGLIENLSQHNADASVKHMYCAIQQGGGAISTTIKGGKISTPTYRSIRVNHGSLTISGGECEGQVWMQPYAADTSLSVSGGEFAPRGVDGSSIFVENSSKGVAFEVTGGYFHTRIGASTPVAAIKGGLFDQVAKEKTNSAMLVSGYGFVEKSAGLWEVVAL